MSTFYLLPSRPEVGERMAAVLSGYFPGLDWGRQKWADLAETLGAEAGRHADVYVVYRDELPDDEDPATVLTEVFGAVAGDEVVEVFAGRQPSELHTRRWRLGGRAAA